MNIVAHCQVGTTFLHSKDASIEKHDANYIFQFIDKAINRGLAFFGRLVLHTR